MTVLADFHTALRTLAHARAFTAIAFLTLAVGFALVTIVLTALNAYVVRALPYPEADRLYRVDYAPPGQQWPSGMEHLDWSSLRDVAELTIAWDLDVFYLLGREYPETAPGAWVTQGYMQGYGIPAARGRTFSSDDFQPGAASVAMISHRLWQGRFGGDPEIIGQTFAAYVSDRPEEAESFTIVGVLPEDLWHVNSYTEVLAPLRAPAYPYHVRLQPGISPSVAQDVIDRLVRGGVASLPPHFVVRLTSVQNSYVTELKPMLWSVVAGSALVLLIAAVNVGVLMIVRARRRERELAVRVALGASHRRVARTIALEAWLIVGAASIAGIAAAAAVLPRMAPWLEQSLERRVPGGVDALTLDTTVLLVLLACGVALGVLLAAVGVAATWSARNVGALAASARGTTDGIGMGRSRAVLIGVEVAVSLTLIVGAALMVESARRMLRVDFGIVGDQVTSAGLTLRQRTFPDASQQVAFYERLGDEIRRIRGVSAVAFGTMFPLQQTTPRTVETSARAVRASRFVVSDGYFDTLQMRVIEGRGFTGQDRAGGPHVAVVSATLARELWPGGSPLGETLRLHNEQDTPPLAVTVVGVVNDTRQTYGDTELFDIYIPLAQHAGRFAFIYIRHANAPGWEMQVRQAVRRVHPEVALGAPRALTEIVDSARARARLLMSVLVIFAVFSCTLALVGMHGVIAYAVRQRHREVAVRIAVGASSRAITAMFVRYGMVVLSAGLAAGVVGAFALGRLLQSQLFGVQPAEPRVIAAATASFGAVAMLAVLWPAWRATAIDPIAVLRED
jgi:putative ABC transport system permease protein